MREILFKAKRKDNGEWVEGYVSQCVIVGKWHMCRIEENMSTTQIEIDPNTICQYTGLTDKNGKRIWENDIVELPDEDGYFKYEWEEDTARFVLNADGLIVDFDNYWAHEVEVVGNVFDNAELLEVE